ncbi:MAG: hypothetical protein RL334_736 [Chloroflexota bacterium]
MPIEAERKVLIENLRQLPVQLRAALRGLTPAQLTTHFLANEWTVAQNVHHLQSSHTAPMRGQRSQTAANCRWSQA